jgi:hypothetical protein
MPTTLTKQNPACPDCKHTTRKGKRRNRPQTLQVFQCANTHSSNGPNLGESGKCQPSTVERLRSQIETLSALQTFAENAAALHGMTSDQEFNYKKRNHLIKELRRELADLEVMELGDGT